MCSELLALIAADGVEMNPEVRRRLFDVLSGRLEQLDLDETEDERESGIHAGNGNGDRGDKQTTDSDLNSGKWILLH